MFQPTAIRSAWSATRAELARRNALAREPQPDGVPLPPLRLLWGELATAAQTRLARRRIGGLSEPAERPLPVMLLPGFGAHPARMKSLERTLTAAGHPVRDWGLGINLAGPSEPRFATLDANVAAFADHAGQPVVLLGWSLGGLYAREIARRRPDAVSGVITMGSPFSGDRHANRAWRAYQWITGQTVDNPAVPCDFAVKPPVPTVALWSPRDGVVSAHSARGLPHERDRAVAVDTTHLGFASHPAVAQTVLDELRLFAQKR